MDWDFLQTPIFLNIVASGVIVVLALAIRTGLIRAVLKNASKSEVRRPWVVSIRNATLLIIAVGLVAIWSDAIESFGTALLAIAVAFVIATRELIQCVLGSLIRTAGNTYSVGHRIEVESYRGDVVDLNLLTTTLLEVGPGKGSHLRTGRTIVFPNSMLVDTIVVNESLMEEYVVHTFAVPVQMSDDWKRAERVLLEAAEQQSAPYVETARSLMRRLERKHGLKGLALRPRVTLELTEPDKVNLAVRVPVPVGSQNRVEQSILRSYLEAKIGGQEVKPARATPIETASPTAQQS